jgi:hypothetical protein
MNLKLIKKRPLQLILILEEIPRIRIKRKLPFGVGMNREKTYLLELVYL